MTIQVALTIIAILFVWTLFTGWMNGWKDEDK